MECSKHLCHFSKSDYKKPMNRLREKTDPPSNSMHTHTHTHIASLIEINGDRKMSSSPGQTKRENQFSRKLGEELKLETKWIVLMRAHKIDGHHHNLSRMNSNDTETVVVVVVAIAGNVIVIPITFLWVTICRHSGRKRRCFPPDLAAKHTALIYI